MMNNTKTAPAANNTNVLRRERESRPYYLEQCAGEGFPRKVPLEKMDLVVRNSGTGISVEADDRATAYARLTRKGDEFVLRDLESQTGTFLNGVRVHSAVLRDGDVIQVADCVFVYREG